MYLPQDIIDELMFFLFPDKLLNKLKVEKPIENLDEIIEMLNKEIRIDPGNIINICNRENIKKAFDKIFKLAERARRAKYVLEEIHELLKNQKEPLLKAGTSYDIKNGLHIVENNKPYFINHLFCLKVIEDRKDYYEIVAVPIGYNNRKRFTVKIDPATKIEEVENILFKKGRKRKKLKLIKK